jgi:(2Fe-2S) ferredoxin
VASALDVIRKKRAEAVSRIISKGYLSTKRVYVGMATCEIAAGSKEVMAIFREAVSQGGLTDVYLSQKGCAGRCNLEPTVEVVEAGKIPVRYGKIDEKKAQEIVERHLKNGEVIEEWVIN